MALMESKGRRLLLAVCCLHVSWHMAAAEKIKPGEEHAGLSLVPGEEEALLAFKAGLKNTAGLDSWKGPIHDYISDKNVPLPTAVSIAAGHDPCHMLTGSGGWHGVHCARVELPPADPAGPGGGPAPPPTTHSAVHTLSLNHENLAGTLAPELSELRWLKRLFLRANPISGPSPRHTLPLLLGSPLRFFI